MLNERYREKVQCSRCSELCYQLCYIGGQVVCVDCFGKACVARKDLAVSREILETLKEAP